MTNSYLDFDLEIGRNNDGIYPVQARWQGNEAYHEATLPSDSDPTRLRKEIEEAVLDSPLRRRRAFSSNEETVRYFGQRLFDFALSGEVLAQLRACQRAAKSQSHEGVRLRLRILDPELAGLPWEYLYDSRLRDFIALDPTLPIVRYLHHPQAVPPLQISLPLRILAMVASPINLAKLDVEAEKQRVEQAVRALQAAGRVELVWLPGDGALDLQAALRKGPWHIFHFVGHGDFDAQRDEGYLILCNPRNKQAETLHATQLARLLAAQSNNLRFVLLNACESARGSSSDIFSSTAETLINRDIPAVLAMQYSITDDAATIFAQHLYQALADGLPIDRSVAEARNALSLADSQNLEWGVPVLHMRSPDGLLFDWRESKQDRGNLQPAERAQEKPVVSNTQLAESAQKKLVAGSTQPAQSVQEKPVVGNTQPAQSAQKKPVVNNTQPVESAQKKPVVSNTQPAESAKPKLLAKWQKIGFIQSAESAESAKPKPVAKWQEIGIEMVRIAAGKFLYGENKQKLSLPEFCIAKTPVTNQQYQVFVTATKYEAPSHWESGRIPVGKENHPVVRVSWDDAQAFCKWAGVQLPSEQQWEKAARGTNGREFPWGNEEPDRNRCNFNNNEKGTTPVGKYPAGANGLLDMAGNVWEWCEDWYDDSQKYRVVRGGAFFGNHDSVRCAVRNRNNPLNDWSSDGFRVVAPSC